LGVASYERVQDALIILKLIAPSEEDFQHGRWLSEAQMEKKFRELLGDCALRPAGRESADRRRRENWVARFLLQHRG
jgi:hypothetical protein